MKRLRATPCRFSFGLILVSASVLLQGCSEETEVLVIFPGVPDPVPFPREGLPSLYREITADFPAQEEIAEVSRRMEVHGWTARKTDILNPGLSTSIVRGWGDFIDASRTRPEHVRQYMLQWENKRGGYVSYFFVYRSPVRENDGGEDLPDRNRVEYNNTEMTINVGYITDDELQDFFRQLGGDQKPLG